MALASIGRAGQQVRSVTVKVGADVKDFNRQFGVMNEVTSTLADELLGLETKFIRVARRVGQTMMGLGAAAQGMVAWATMTASSWEEAFAMVEKTVDAGVQQLRDLDATIRKLSLDIPIRAENLAGLAALAGQLGVSTNAIDEFTGAAAKLGEATDLSAEQAIFQLSQFSNIMGTAETEIENLGSALVALGNNTASTEAAILNFSTRIAGVGNVVGLSESEVFGIAAAMASAGVEAERGGTAVSKVLLAINEAARTGGQRLEVFTKVMKMTKEEFRNLQETNPGEVFARFVESLRDAGDEGVKVLKMLRLEDQRLVQSFLSLAQSSQDVRSTMGLANEAFVEGTALSEEAAKRFNTLRSAMTRISNSFIEIRRAIGEFFLPAVARVANAIAEVVGKVASLAATISSKIPEPIQELIGWIGLAGTTALFAAGALLSMTHAVVALGNAFGIVQGFKFLTEFIKSRRQADAALGFLGLLVQRMKELVPALKAATMRMAGWIWLISTGGFRNGVELMKILIAALTKRVLALSAAFLTNPVTLAIAALGAAAYVASRHIRDMDARIEAASKSVATLASTVGASVRTVDDLGSALSGTGEEADTTAQKLLKLNNIIKLMEAGATSPDSRRAFILSYLQSLRDAGAEMEEVKEAADLLNMALPPSQQIKLDIALEGLDDDVLQRLQVARQTFEDFHLDANLATGGPRRWLDEIFATDQTELGAEKLAQQADAMALLFEEGFSGSPEGLSKLLVDLQGIEEAMDGLVSSQRQSTLKFFAQELEQDLRNIEGLEEIDLSPAMGITDPLMMLERALNEPTVGIAARNLIKDLGWGETALEMSDEEVMATIRGLQRQIISTGEFLSFPVKFSGIDEEKTRLEQALGETFESLSGDAAAQNAFIRDTINTLINTEGAEETVEILEEHRDALGDLSEVYKSEIGRTIVSEIQRLKEKIAQVDIERLEREIQGLGFSDAMKRLDQEMRSLAASTNDTTEATARLAEMRQRLIDQQLGELRSLLSQEESLGERRAELTKDHKKNLAELAEEERKAVREHGRNLREAFGLFERIQSNKTASLSAMLLNSKDQNEVMQRWRRAIEQLTSMGVSTDMLKSWGLTDPMSWQQAERIAKDALTNPSMLQELTSTWEAGFNVGEIISKSIDGGEVNERFDEQRENLVESYEEAMAEISKQIRELGKSTALSLEEAIEKGKNSASPHIRELARTLEQEMRDAAGQSEKAMHELRERSREHFFDMGSAAERQAARIQLAFENAAAASIAAFQKLPGAASPSTTSAANSGEGRYYNRISGLAPDVSKSANAEAFKADYELQQRSRALTGSATPDGFDAGKGGQDTTAALKRTAYQLMIQAGYSHSQWDDLERLVQNESSWSPRAQNPTSTAYGLFQFLNSTWAEVGMEKTSDPTGQIRAGLAYIRKRYGTPERALQFWQARVPIDGQDKGNWYAAGSLFTGPQRIGVGEAGPEAVIPLNAKGLTFMTSAMQRAMPRTFASQMGGMSSSTITHSTTFHVDRVVASDPMEMARKLKARERLSRLATMGAAV